jgi:hypothetical protein
MASRTRDVNGIAQSNSHRQIQLRKEGQWSQWGRELERALSSSDNLRVDWKWRIRKVERVPKAASPYCLECQWKKDGFQRMAVAECDIRDTIQCRTRIKRNDPETVIIAEAVSAKQHH